MRRSCIHGSLASSNDTLGRRERAYLMRQSEGFRTCTERMLSTTIENSETPMCPYLPGPFNIPRQTTK